jgi:enoyl-CoA hydratase/carnithine racemase
VIGEGMTKYLVMTGDSIDAARAHEVGLVEELHEESEFDDAVDRLEARLAERPTYVHGLAKRQIHSVRPPNVDQAMQQAIHHAIAAYHEEETQRRVSEFFEG